MGLLGDVIDDLIDLSGGNVNKMYNIAKKPFNDKKSNTNIKQKDNNKKKKIIKK